MEIPLMDPNGSDAYNSIRDQVIYHKEEKGRFVYVQTPARLYRYEFLPLGWWPRWQVLPLPAVVEFNFIVC